MPETKASSEGTKPPGVFGWLFHAARPLETETARFVLASALDFFVTYLLLVFSSDDGHGAEFYESNPIARYFYDRWDHYGLIGFKFGTVAFVAIISQIIAAKHERTARWLLNFATIVVGGVVIYSLVLFWRHVGV